MLKAVKFVRNFSDNRVLPAINIFRTDEGFKKAPNYLFIHVCIYLPGSVRYLTFETSKYEIVLDSSWELAGKIVIFDEHVMWRSLPWYVWM